MRNCSANKRKRTSSDGAQQPPVLQHINGDVDDGSEVGRPKILTAIDKGHRFGNFHNYYQFHPVNNRTSLLGGILDLIGSEWNLQQAANSFRFLDIGCNEGDLTLEVAKLLSDRIDGTIITGTKMEGTSSETNMAKINVPLPSAYSLPTVKVTGLDLDPILIHRARQKFQDLHNKLSPKIQADFRAVDVLTDGIIEDALSATNSPSSFTADMTALFSATMWIHIHGGDEGLRRVLKQICESTSCWILLEPQPSRCYGMAANRLRRMGLEPLNVSSERLQLRPNAVEDIEKILLCNHFQRVAMGEECNKDGIGHNDVGCVDEGEGSIRDESKTLWNRSLRLYRRAPSMEGKPFGI